jgi:hypothetical protein
VLPQKPSVSSLPGVTQLPLAAGGHVNQRDFSRPIFDCGHETVDKGPLSGTSRREPCCEPANAREFNCCSHRGAGHCFGSVHHHLLSLKCLLCDTDGLGPANSQQHQISPAGLGPVNQRKTH